MDIRKSFVFKSLKTMKGKIIVGGLVISVLLLSIGTAYSINTSGAKEEQNEEVQAEEPQDEIVQVDNTDKPQETPKQDVQVKDEPAKSEVVVDNKSKDTNNNANAEKKAETTTTNNKSAQENKPVNNGSITYKSPGLRIAFDMPRSWENNYVIKDNGTEINVYMKHKDNSKGIGYLFTITSDINSYEGGQYLDGIGVEKKQTINGRQYLIGGPLDVRIYDNDPKRQTFSTMSRESGSVAKTIRAV